MGGILALDLGTKTGWANDNGSGVWKFQKLKNTHPGDRFMLFEATLSEYVERCDSVVYEKVMGHGKGGSAAAHLYGAFEGLLMKVCATHHKPIDHVHVSTLKKYATGNGRANKEQMIAAAQVRGWEPVDDNHADALWLLQYARAGQC